MFFSLAYLIMSSVGKYTNQFRLCSFVTDSSVALIHLDLITLGTEWHEAPVSGGILQITFLLDLYTDKGIIVVVSYRY